MQKVKYFIPASWPSVETFIPGWNIFFLHIILTLVSSRDENKIPFIFTELKFILNFHPRMKLPV